VSDMPLRGDVYYDPYDVVIDDDPYPVWKRMREDAPLYYNEKFELRAQGAHDECQRLGELADPYEADVMEVVHLVADHHAAEPGLRGREGNCYGRIDHAWYALRADRPDLRVGASI